MFLNWQFRSVCLSLFAVVLSNISLFVSKSDAAEPIAFKKCLHCHSMKAGVHKTGPSLNNIFGRRAGTAIGFRGYSNSLKNSGIVWDQATLEEFIDNPRSVIAGVKMAYRSESKADTDEVVSYLLGQSGAIYTGRSIDDEPVPNPGITTFGNAVQGIIEAVRPGNNTRTYQPSARPGYTQPSSNQAGPGNARSADPKDPCRGYGIYMRVPNRCAQPVAGRSSQYYYVHAFQNVCDRRIKIVTKCDRPLAESETRLKGIDLDPGERGETVHNRKHCGSPYATTFVCGVIR